MTHVYSSTRVETAEHIAALLSDLHTFALRSYIAENSAALTYLYGAMPMPDKDALTGAINDMTTELLPYGGVATFWTDLVHAETSAGVTDAMQICNNAGLFLIARRRRAYVHTAQTFWLSYWNTYKIW